MTEKLKIGIAGYGVVGQRRRQHIDLHPALHTVAVCDRSFDVDGPDAEGILHCQSYKRLLEEDLDVLFVCMTNDIAPEVTMAGLRRGLHVFCEKPPGRTVQDVLDVIEEEKKNPGLKLKYGFNHRYHDSVRDALQLTRSGDMGEVINMRGVYGKSKFISFGQQSDWRVSRDVAGGGILLDQGIHMVDLMRLFGGEFEDVHSFVTNNFWKHDIEDNAYALMRSDRGVVAMLHSTATQWRHRFSLDITLEKGAISLSGILSGSKSYGTETMTVARASNDDRGDPEEEALNYETDPSWSDEIAEFTDAVLSGKPITEGTSTDALNTMKLVNRIYCADKDWAAQWGLTDT